MYVLLSLYILQIEATGGCEASPDESGTEMVGVDNMGRRAAVSFNDTAKPISYFLRVEIGIAFQGTCLESRILCHRAMKSMQADSEGPSDLQCINYLTFFLSCSNCEMRVIISHGIPSPGIPSPGIPSPYCWLQVSSVSTCLLQLVCPRNAGKYACGVYLTGDVVTQAYNQNQSGRRRLLQTGIMGGKYLMYFGY